MPNATVGSGFMRDAIHPSPAAHGADRLLSNQPPRCLKAVAMPIHNAVEEKGMVRTCCASGACAVAKSLSFRLAQYRPRCSIVVVGTERP